MASLPIYNQQGEQVGVYEIDPAQLAPRISKQLLHDVVVMYQSNLRQGSARTKSRGEVAGSTKKMYRQKGTGNARAGSRRSGIRRGGGHIHAIRERAYFYRLPRKALQAATRMALASKIQSEQVVVVDQLTFAEPKTKAMAQVLKALGLSGVTTLIATDQLDLNVHKSARNIPGASVAPVTDLNALNVLSPKRLLVTRAALDVIASRGSATTAS